MKPVIFGMSGLTLTAEEIDFFKESDPAGYILFGRNIENREQLRALTDSLREISGREAVPILIDQEGGRVARMNEPEWPQFPSGDVFHQHYQIAPASAIEAARLNAQALGHALQEVGINVDCLPLLDVRQEDTIAAIGDRALGYEPKQVAALGRAILDGLRRSGVAGIMKHIPGHGRAVVDSHMELPIVSATAAELESDIVPFRVLANTPMAMTAHIVYEAWDKDRCATMSPVIINDIIRGKIGFDGLLFSDDLDMKALKGDHAQRAFDVVAAGCDIALNCWGRMPEMQKIADMLDDINPLSKARLDRALEAIEPAVSDASLAELAERRDALLAAA